VQRRQRNRRTQLKLALALVRWGVHPNKYAVLRMTCNSQEVKRVEGSFDCVAVAPCAAATALRMTSDTYQCQLRLLMC
jgi:hypothetical protein